MFNWSGMSNSYNERCVGNFRKDDLRVSTALVTDGEKPYETAISHPEYNDGKLIIIEAYDTEKLANEGHSKWIGIVTSDALPEFLQDCQNSGISKMLDADSLKFKRERKSDGGHV